MVFYNAFSPPQVRKFGHQGYSYMLFEKRRGDPMKFPAFGRKKHIRLPPPKRFPVHLRGGILMKGGILRWNTPDPIGYVTKI